MTLGQIQLLSAYVVGSGQLHTVDLTAILAAVDAYPTRVTVYTANQATQTTYKLTAAGGSWIGLGTVIAGTDQSYPAGSLVSLQCNAADISGGGGGGSGTVNAGTTNQLAGYAGAGTTVGGVTLGTGLSITSSTLNATAVGTIASGTSGQLAVYSGTGTTVAGKNTGIEIDSSFGAIGAVTASGAAASVNAATNNKWTVNLSHTASTAITITGAVFGQPLYLRLVQDSTGTNLASFPGITINWQPSSYSFALSTPGNTVDAFTFVCTGTNTFDAFPPYIPGNSGPAVVFSYTTPGTATWTKPSGKSAHRVYAVGAGAGGGSGAVQAATASGGAGGGGGCGVIGDFIDSDIASTVTVTIAAGGAPAGRRWPRRAPSATPGPGSRAALTILVRRYCNRVGAARAAVPAARPA